MNGVSVCLYPGQLFIGTYHGHTAARICLFGRERFEEKSQEAIFESPESPWLITQKILKQLSAVSRTVQVRLEIRPGCFDQEREGLFSAGVAPN